MPDRTNLYKKILNLFCNSYLVRLTNDIDSDVRASSNHSLGRVSIFMASQAETEEDYKKELENAIVFFETAAHQSISWKNPAQFCLPFYRSFYTIIFKRQEAKEEVNRYLAEAKAAIAGSESKKQLFEAVENLSNALKEVQNLENLDLFEMKDELSFYRSYCDHAVELMKYTDEKTPYATRVLKKGLPILDRNLKELIEEIQKKAKIACKDSIGTATEEIARAVNGEVQKWEISNQEEMTQNIESIINIFRIRMPHLPGYDHIFREIEGIKNEKDLVKQYKIVSGLIGLIPMFTSMPDCVIHDIKAIKDNTIETNVRLDTISKQLDCIRFNIFKNKLNSYNVISNLDSMKLELEKLNEVVNLNTFSINQLSSTQESKLNNLGNNISKRLKEIEKLVKTLPNNEDTKKIFNSLNELKLSDPDLLLQRSSGIATLISFIVMFIQIYLQYRPF